MISPAMKIDRTEIASFSKKWKITRLALFGSVLRDDFGPESDIDVLVDFSTTATWDLFDFVLMKEELEAILHRPVDLLERQALVNPFRRREILSHLEVLFEA